jgi:protein-tyrosine-phosphatase
LTCGYAAARFSRHRGGECHVPFEAERISHVSIAFRVFAIPCLVPASTRKQPTQSQQQLVWSGGSEPTGKINPAAVAVMAERGIDISGEYPKPWTGEIIAAADVIVSMGCGDAVPALPGRRYEDWDLDDPAGKDVAEVRLIRDEIEHRVRELLDALRIPYRS